MNNYENIKNMNIDELADYLSAEREYERCGLCKKDNCKDCFKIWLKQEITQ